jgi:hypothetical protein
VVTFAVAESRPQIFRQVLQRDHDFEVLGFWLAEVCCDVETPVSDDGVVPISVTAALKIFGNSVDGDLSGLAGTTLTMSVSSTLPSAVITDMSARS